MDSLTFAHSIRVSLQFTVFHAWNEVKQSKNLFLGESGSSRHHQAACNVPRAVVHELVAARVSWTGGGASQHQDKDIATTLILETVMKKNGKHWYCLHYNCFTLRFFFFLSYAEGVHTGSWAQHHPCNHS